MTTEAQPINRSDTEPLSPKERLRRSVLGIATQPVELVGDNPFAVVQCGYLRLPGAQFIMAEIIAPTEHLPQDMRAILPSRLLKLSVCDSTGEGSVNSITMSDDTDSTVVGNIGTTEYDSMTPAQEEAYILRFYTDNHLSKLPV